MKEEQKEMAIDRTPSGGFDGIAQMLMEQKRIMEALEAENGELRRQLTNLRQGIGITLVVDGKVIPLLEGQSGVSVDEVWRQAAQSPLGDSFVL